MNHNSRPVILTIAWRVVFAGLVLLFAWLLLFLFRGAIPDSLIGQINLEQNLQLSYDSSSWDWTSSLKTGEPISELIEPRLGFTLQLIGFSGFISLILAGILLSFGVLISRISEGPSWLASLRSIVRLVVVSSGASVPIFVMGHSSVIFILIRWYWSPPVDSLALTCWIAFLTSLLPAWLLVQSGHGELAKWHRNTPYTTLVKHVGITLLTRVFRLMGLIIVVNLSVGVGGLLFYTRDFPLIFSIAWLFVIIVTLAKLAADLIEIAYNHFRKAEQPLEPITEKTTPQFAIPKWWLIFCLVLVGISVLAAIAAPLLAPYGYNETYISEKLTPPSEQHLLGTDNVGRDILSRVLQGMRIDVLAGLACAAIVSGLAFIWVLLEARAKKAGNRVGAFFEKLLVLPREILCAFPWLVLLLILMSIASSGNGVIIVVLICSLVLVPRAVAMIREAYQSLPEGNNWLQNLTRTIPIIVLFSVAGGIFYISTLSYNRYGIPPPNPELGAMLTGSSRAYVVSAPWMAQWPLFCLILLLTTWVMAGEALLERLGFRSKAVWSKVME